ncbi:glycine cleavage system protein GcvH [Megamonas hypermegale]|uniref:glycine cleavage system protein GcvH n=1 Tax=Megamonas hypermegale TaxID=158847 RepID=UPI0032088814
MNFPEELMYVKSHEWIKNNGDGTYLIGITDYAQDALGDLVFVNLPEEGDSVEKSETFADVESVKAVSDVFSPVTAVIEAVNEELADDPAQINSDPYGAWFIKVNNLTDHEDLLSAKEYEEFIATLD